jgi:hypothetical protein
LQDDPRRWAPEAVHEVRIDTRLPRALRPGTYAAYLSLPDPAPRLRGRPAYSIRLANKGLWKPRTGYNDLGIRIAVTRQMNRRLGVTALDGTAKRPPWHE